MEEKIYDVPSEWSHRAYLDDAGYRAKYEASIRNPDAFWAEEAKRIHWFKAPTRIKNTNFGPGNVAIRWFEDGVTNVAYNCIDRHLHTRGDQVAIIWEGDDPAESKTITYRELHDEVCRMANIMRNRGVEKGDRVTIYMPMIPEAAYAMLACARLGAIHSVVFGGFSPDSLASRIQDAKSAFIITADEGLRGGRKVPLKVNVDAAIERVGAGVVDHVLVVRRTTTQVVIVGQRFIASSALALSGTLRPPRRPSSAVIRQFDWQSWMRPTRLSGEKPPNTTEWMAPMRAQASMA